MSIKWFSIYLLTLDALNTWYIYIDFIPRGNILNNSS